MILKSFPVICLIETGSIVFETTITGVSSTGKLLTNDVMEREFDFDEVEWIK